MTTLMLSMAMLATIVLPTLPYEKNALEPQISAECIDYHYGKHHKAYVDNLNRLIQDTPMEEMTLEDIVKSSTGAIFNNAAQVLNHTFFFFGLSPKPQTAPTGALAAAIDRDFGNLENFKTAFTKAAVAQFGSGWAWLVADKEGKLSITTTANAATPLTDGLTPLMNADVWEHAYYIDYRNRRADFLNALWQRLDWATVENRFKQL